jgi:hypothetical protein
MSKGNGALEDKCDRCNAPITWSWVEDETKLVRTGWWVPIDVGTDAMHECDPFYPQITYHEN